MEEKMRNLTINKYHNLNNGFIADIGNDLNVEIPDEKCTIFIVSDIDNMENNDNITYIPAKIVICEFEEFTYQVAMTNMILETVVI